MPIPVVVAGGGTRDAVFDELRDLLVSMGEECDVIMMALLDQPDSGMGGGPGLGQRHQLCQMRKMQTWYLR